MWQKFESNFSIVGLLQKVPIRFGSIRVEELENITLKKQSSEPSSFGQISSWCVETGGGVHQIWVDDIYCLIWLQDNILFCCYAGQQQKDKHVLQYEDFEDFICRIFFSDLLCFTVIRRLSKTDQRLQTLVFVAFFSVRNWPLGPSGLCFYSIC